MERGLPFREIIVLVFMMTFFCPHMGHSQGIHILHTPSTITAVLGQDLTIPCFVARNDNQELDLDLSSVNVGWTKRSSNGDIHDVYKYLGHSDEQIRPGSLIEENELKRGNASLTLYYAQTIDEGEYTCTVFITPQKATAVVDVHLLAQPNVTLSSAELIVEPGREKSLTCEVTRFYPEAVKIRWVKYRKGSGTRSSLDKATFLSVPEENSDGTFNTSSLLTVSPSSLEEDGDLYSCVVTHLSFNQDQAINFTLTVKEPPTSHPLPLIILLTFVMVVIFIIVFLHFMKLPPKISDIVGIEDLVHGKSSNLSWMVSGFKPRNIEIRAYLERGDQRQELGSWKYPPPQAQNYDADREKGFSLLRQTNVIKPFSPNHSSISYNCLCSTSITPDKRKDKEDELIIEVKHSALKTTLIKRQKLNIKGAQPVVEQITSEHDGQQMKLSCRVHCFFPPTIEIKWFKEDEELPTTDCELHIDEDGLYNATSTLMYIPETEDIGKTFRCKVNHQSLPNPELRECKLEEQRMISTTS